MKTLLYSLLVSSLSTGPGSALETISYSNYIRHYQMPSGLSWDASSEVPPNGSQFSNLAIQEGGARLDLHTIKSSSLSGLTSYLLDTSYVGTYVPVATISIRSEDMTGVIPRTRVDIPFYVDVTINGLRTGLTDPAASKSVKLLHHAQSYGVGGSAVGIDRTQAILISQSAISSNGQQTLTFTYTSVPGADRSKVKGEERFSVFSLADYQAPEMQLASQYIEILPIADATISGISNNDVIKSNLPPLTLTFNDLYPKSTIYAQVYKGDPVLGTEGTKIAASQFIVDPSTTEKSLSITDYGSVFTSDGRWTIELNTVTPFGPERLQTPSGSPAVLSFDLDKTINVNSTVTTIE